jgi:HEAT repeat protein
LVAYRAVAKNMPKIARELAKEMSHGADFELRLLVLNVLQESSDDEGLRIQGQLLNDTHPEIRRMAAANLIDKGEQGGRAVVDEIVLTNLKSGEWAAMEKAVEIIVKLQDRRYCKAFVRLLDHARPEVSMHAAWALMELCTESEILAGMLSHAEKLTAELQSKDYKPTTKTATDQIRLSYLNEAFGKNRYTPANELLLKFIPKRGHQFGIVSRASAIWALGKLNTLKDNPSLRASMYDRMQDFEPSSPEDILVRFSCNLALGEMAHPESKDVIEQYGEQLPSQITHAATWALSQIEKAHPNQVRN